MNTDTYKKKLEETKAMLEEELGLIGHEDPKQKDDFHPDPKTMDVPETADRNILADRHEDFEERVVINAALEERLENVNKALERIENGTYGICSVSGKPIEEERLNANPAADTCIAHMEQK